MSKISLWKEINIKTWKELLEQIYIIQSSKMVYRGQANSAYKLESSLRREKDFFSNEKRGEESLEQMLIRIENTFIERFRTEYHLYLQNDSLSNLSDLDILSLLQHYGAPTRLLDWSYSPFISTYFAVSNNFNSDSVLYALDLEYITRLNETKIKEYMDATGKQNKKVINPIEFGKHYADSKARADKKGDLLTEEIILVPYESSKKNIRLARQQGLFLISSKIDINYEEITAAYKTDKKDEVALKIVIDKDIKLDILRNLQLMNISSEILFPEMEGYCKGLKYKLLRNNYPVMRGEVK